MKNLLILLFLIIGLNSCDNITGNGNIVTDKRQLGNFTAISVGGGFNVEVKIGATQEVTVEADDNLIEYVETKVSNGKLLINMRQHSLTNAHLHVYITASEINSINASAGADVDVKDQLKSAEEINLTASSGATINSSVDAPNVTAHTSSAGIINVDGRTRNFNAESSSGASINATKLLSENTEAVTSSGASAHVYSSVQLNANASSGGSINYTGGGTTKINTSSGGSVSKDD
jgi:hypothetical protein